MNGLRCFLIVGIGVASLMATGCASVMNGSHQDLAVTSQPEALCVNINGAPYGQTPVVASLPRQGTYVVQVRMDAYQPYELTVVPVMNGMIWGNLILGGLIGMAVDNGTGAGYEHSPSRVHAYFPVPIGQSTKRGDCPESAYTLEMRRKEAEKAIVVKSVYTPYEQPMGR